MTKHIGDIEYGTEMTGKELILAQARRMGLHPNAFDLNRAIYDTEDITRYVNRLEKYEAMTIDEIEKELEESLKAEVTFYEQRQRRAQELRSKYEKLGEEVKSWEPPTEAHIKLKEKALAEIREYIEWKCVRVEEATHPSESPFRLSAQEYKDMMVKHCKEQIEYYKEKYKDEQERVAESKQFMEQLMESLPQQEGEENK